MPKKTTQLTAKNLRIYASQRLTDTDDGGGMMTNQVLTGAKNELFNPISRLARTMGDLDTRLVYPAVLTADTATLLGANVIVSQPPSNSKTSVLLVKGDFYGQERASIMERIEGYRVPTTETRMTLLGKQRKGSRLVQVYQRENAPFPVVGQVLALRLVVNGNEVFEFIRIASFNHEIATFEDDKGEFTRRVITITTSQALERDFVGVETASRYYQATNARVMSTQIADSASYYGIKPIAAEIHNGSSSLRVSSLYEQLVPVSTVETAIADDWAQGRAIWIETAPERVVWSGGNISGSVYLETPVLPSSIQLSGWVDDGTGNLKNGEQSLSVDYANGVISGFTGQYIGVISAIPAVQVHNYAYSAHINIDDTNVGTEWSPLLRPTPARGSVQVSYRSGKTWYELNDNGDFVLRDDNNVSRGEVSVNGSCIISLPVLPDSGSQIIVSWCPNGYYQTVDEQSAGNTIAPQKITSELVLPPTPIPNLQPNSIVLSWNGGSAKDEGNGNLIGDCAGKVNYATGEIRPTGLTIGKVKLTAKQFSAVANTRNVPTKIATGSKQISLVAGQIQKGSLKLALSITRTTATGYTVRRPMLLATSAN